MFKKIASLALAASMAVGTAAITASAAEADEAEVAADQSSAVAADESSAVAADSSSEVGASKVFYFDVKSVGWESLASQGIFCHIYRYDGDESDDSGKKIYTDWQTKSEKCTYDAATGIATYDIQTGIAKGAVGLNDINGDNKWCIMFSCKAGAETYPLLMNSSCFGDTVYAPDKDKKLENNVDSTKSSVEIKWKKSSLTSPLCVTSTGKIQGESLAYGETKETVMASFLVTYATEEDKLKDTQSIINKLNVSPANVYAIVLGIQEDAVKAGTKKQDAVDKENAAIKAVLEKCTDPTASAGSEAPADFDKITAVDKDEAVKNPSSVNNAAGTSSTSTSTGSTSTSSGSSSSSSNGSVKSGQETTIFFMLGGIVLAAAGVLFLARRKREF